MQVRCRSLVAGCHFWQISVLHRRRPLAPPKSWLEICKNQQVTYATGQAAGIEIMERLSRLWVTWFPKLGDIHARSSGITG
jgi:hypothetical protein